MKPALVILAAGIGRRFGGPKQLAPVGSGGATIMDYSIYDALRAGFGQIAFVVRREMETVVREALGRRYAQRVPVAYAFQRLDDLPAGFAPPLRRVKPWGTLLPTIVPRQPTVEACRDEVQRNAGPKQLLGVAPRGRVANPHER
jgi:hypothetical protein